MQCFQRVSAIFSLFVFHRGGWFGRVVDEDAVDAGDFGGDAGCEALDEVLGEVLGGDFHYVYGVDGADDARPVEGALAVLDAGGLEVRDDGEVALPAPCPRRWCSRPRCSGR